MSKIKQEEADLDSLRGKCKGKGRIDLTSELDEIYDRRRHIHC